MRNIVHLLGAGLFLAANMAVPTCIYFSTFKDFDWVYAQYSLLMFFISLFIAAFTLEKENRVEKTWVLIIGGTGWVWLLSTPLTLWFIFAALFMDGSWWEFWYSMAVCSIFGGWCKGFQRLALEKRLESESS